MGFSRRGVWNRTRTTNWRSTNRAAVEGIKDVGQWQMKILNETMEGISKAAGEMTKARSPRDVVVERTELAKRALEAAVKSMRELAVNLYKAN